MGMETMMVTGTSLEESKEALAIAERYGESFLFFLSVDSPSFPATTTSHSPHCALRHCGYLIIM